MARTPDRFSGPRYEEKIILEQEDQQGDPTVDPTEEGGLTYHDGEFAGKDSQGLLNPREVSVSSNDSTTGTLDTKLVAGPGVSLDEIGNGGDEQLRVSAFGVAGVVVEVEFRDSLYIPVLHSKTQRPLIQVLVPVPLGWNVGRWNVMLWNLSGSYYKRLPDEEYTTIHESPDKFLIVFLTPTTGKVLYY